MKFTGSAPLSMLPPPFFLCRARFVLFDFPGFLAGSSVCDGFAGAVAPTTRSSAVPRLRGYAVTRLRGYAVTRLRGYAVTRC